MKEDIKKTLNLNSGFLDAQSVQQTHFDIIRQWIKENKLRPKQKDIEKIKSLIKSAKTNSEAIKTIELTEKTATIIFRELYESIRQLGESYWLIKGYEPHSHEISLESIKEIEINDRIKLNHLDRYRKIRHDVNYQGFQVTLEQAKELLEFWNSCGKEMIELLEKQI